ncbi:DUF2255 family protein [Compostimonas suwonensis]|uniref:DUF2255 family protein n=1 Tax=Compostimonas suwonensis TaxID=1048394 RepID=A0A2M9C0G9_9MICO|nr:DUF2255 family protein [Compostimonas suwonensis]PJJ63851.1 hypothetical protein CLV54_1527 [Compostimonas suwonensis]
MTTWTSEELDRIGGATELGLASVRRDGSLRRFVTIWVVRVGDDLYVRSGYGRGSNWFSGAMQQLAGRVRAGGIERDVIFEEPGSGVDRAVDTAYHAKYDSHGATNLDPMLTRTAAETTFRLLPV